MLAESGDKVKADGAAIYDHTIPYLLLDQFVLNHNDQFNAGSCVDAIDLFNTNYEMDNGVMENRDVEENITFRKYIKGGSGPLTPENKPADIDSK